MTYRFGKPWSKEEARRPQYQPATKAQPVESDRKQLQPEGTAYTTRSGMPARIINRFPMPDVPSVYGP
jgi:hypothetical protein